MAAGIKRALSLLCAGALALSCGCKRGGLVEIQPAHKGIEKQLQTERDETPEAEPTPAPEASLDEDEETQETPPNEQPEQPEPSGVTVRFFSCDGACIKEETYAAGATLSLSDMPTCEAPTGYLCKWDFPDGPLTAATDCRATRYKTVSSAEEFLAIAGEEKYILTQDIGLSSVDTASRASETGGLIGAFCGVLDGNGHTVSDLTIAGSSVKFLFATLGGTLKNIRLDTVAFAGAATPAGVRRANGCAIVGETTAGARLENCVFKVRYEATASSASAGLALKMSGGSFVGCGLEISAPTGDTQSDGIYAVCVYKAASVSFDGLCVTAADTLIKWKEELFL